MALNFPDSPTNNQVFTDGTGEQWRYNSADNSWTSLGLTNAAGIIYKGSVDITAAPPAGVQSGWQYTVSTGGTANAGYGPGITGAVVAGSVVLFDGTRWVTTTSAIPSATASTAGIQTKLWKRTGTTLAPETANDALSVDGNVTLGGTGGVFFDATAKRLGVGTSSPSFPLHVVGNALVTGVSYVGASRASQTGFAKHINIEGTDASLQLYQTTTGTSWELGNDNTGLFRILNGGTNRFAITAAGNVGVGTTSPGSILDTNGSISISGKTTDLGTARLTHHTNNYLYIRGGSAGAILSDSSSANTLRTDAGGFVLIETNSTERARIDSSGRLLLGTSSDLSGGDADARLQVNGDGGAQILLSRQDFGALTAGTLIGEVVFRSQASGVSETSALIKCEADATQGSGDKPGRLVFSTTADGASSPTERMRIKNNGTINFSNVAVYADNIAAKAGGLVDGDVYRTATGQLMIAFT